MTDTHVPYSHIANQSGFDHERVTRQARVQNPFAWDACGRAGLKTGGAAIDVGCGPLGALPVLSELVGPAGTVVGIDANRAALERAAATLERLGVRGVKLVEADVNMLDQATTLPSGQFDLAHCRLLLMYQPDPAATLRQIARVVRGGGRIVASDFLPDTSYPRFYPPIPAAERIARLLLSLVERRGGTPDVAQQYRRLCEEANLRLIEQRGWFCVASEPAELIDLTRDVVLSMRSNLLDEKLATEEELTSIVSEMDEARSATEFAAYVLFVEMIAEVPAAI